MSQSIIFPIISALAALSGASIALIGQIFDTNYRKSQHQFDIKRRQYKIFIDSMQKINNRESIDDSYIIEFQDAIKVVLLYADDKVANELKEYFKRIVQATDGNLISAEEHNHYQEKIINYMRGDVGVSSKNIKGLGIVLFAKKHK